MILGMFYREMQDDDMPDQEDEIIVRNVVSLFAKWIFALISTYFGLKITEWFKKRPQFFVTFFRVNQLRT